MPTLRSAERSSTLTIWGSRSKSSSDRASRTTTAKRVERSQARRGSPAASPPIAAAISPTSARAWLSSIPRRGRAVARSARPARIRSAVFGPMPGTCVSRSSSAASRRPAIVRTPSALPSSCMRFGERPSSLPTPTSSGIACSSSSRSSASSPVVTSSFRRASIPDPIPASSRTRPTRTRSATSTGVARISSAARRYARTV